MTAWFAGAPHRRGSAGALLSLLLLILAACGDSPTAPPESPVTALAIAQPGSALRRGQTLQLIATATLSNGQVATPQGLAWTTSDENVATVNNGAVTAVADGRATIRASLGAISASADIVVRTGGGTLSGLVTESAPTEDRPVPGARVVVAEGVYADTMAIADGAGRFMLNDVEGALRLRITAIDYQDLTATAHAGASAILRLTPELRRVTESNQWTATPGGPYRENGRLTFAMHHDGLVEIAALAWLRDSDAAAHCAELRDDRNNKVWTRVTPWQGLVKKVLTLPGGRRYELKIHGCDGDTLHHYRLEVVHPS